MLTDKNIICISSIDWDFVWQGHQEIMSTFVQNGNRVLFIENTGVRSPHFKDITRLKKRIQNWKKSTKGFRQERDNLYVYSPVVLPFPYSRISLLINRRLLLKPLERWMKVMDFHAPIIWTFLPTGTALEIINNIDRSLLVYYCIADFHALTDNQKTLKRTEDELIKKCDIVFAQGHILHDKCKRLNDNVHIFPFGVNVNIFNQFKCTADKMPADIKEIKKPLIGYIGGIHKHIDFGLLKNMGEAHPEWSIVMVGPLQTSIEEIKGLKNVFFLGKKEFAELPSYTQEFDVCIIPYLKSEYTATVYPTKLNEYHALGKPVISTYLPEVLNFNKENDALVFVGKDHVEFIRHVASAINEEDREVSVKRVLSAEKNSWSVRINQMSSIMESTIAQKSRGADDWRERFSNFYRGSRKIIKRVFIAVIAYFLIFYTPLIWLLAEPLRISQAPEKADCIVIFAGGVGESGRAMQGYEERVQYGVKLYKSGFADYLVFSSGYKFYFNEPDIMKALAVSLGVPEKKIIVEEKANNTYKNVLLSKKILDQNRWYKILLVSAPYHMKRVALVTRKIAPDINVVFTSVPNSSFYGHDVATIKRPIFKQLNVTQLKSLIHECIAIIVYWFKGWI